MRVRSEAIKTGPSQYRESLERGPRHAVLGRFARGEQHRRADAREVRMVETEVPAKVEVSKLESQSSGTVLTLEPSAGAPSRIQCVSIEDEILGRVLDRP